MDPSYIKQLVLMFLYLLKNTIKNAASKAMAERIAWEIIDAIMILFPRLQSTAKATPAAALNRDLAKAKKMAAFFSKAA